MFQIFLSTPNADVDDCLEHETHIKIVAMIYNFTIKTYKYIFDHIGSAGLAQLHAMASLRISSYMHSKGMQNATLR